MEPQQHRSGSLWPYPESCFSDPLVHLITFQSLTASLLTYSAPVNGITYLVRISRLGSGPWHSTAFTLIYGFTSLTLNILLTFMISIRLYFHRRRVYKVLGKRHGSHYTSIISLLVESASILDVIVLFFLIPFALGSSVANIAMSTLVQVQVQLWRTSPCFLISNALYRQSLLL